MLFSRNFYVRLCNGVTNFWKTLYFRYPPNFVFTQKLLLNKKYREKRRFLSFQRLLHAQNPYHRWWYFLVYRIHLNNLKIFNKFFFLYICVFSRRRWRSAREILFLRNGSVLFPSKCILFSEKVC